MRAGFPPFARLWAEAGGRGHHHHGPWGKGPWGNWRPPFDFDFGFGGRGRGPRARRGDVRAAILRLLSERSMHGYEMIRELGERSGGAWRPSAGSIYPTLQLLQDEGLVVSEELGGGKKLFTITDEGRAEVHDGDAAPWEEFTADPGGAHWHDLRKAGFALMGATMQAGQAANEEQLRRVVETLNEARSKIYRILGDDDPDSTDE